MPNTATLIEVLKDSAQKKVFETVLEKRGLYRVYELATIHNDELTAIQIYFKDFSKVEMDFAPNVYKKVAPLFDEMIADALAKKRKKISQQEGAARNLSEDELKEVYLEARQSPEWKRFFKTSKVVLNQLLNEFAGNEFPHTPEFAEYVRKKAEKEMKALAKANELEAEVDELLGLSVAIATGNSTEAARLSQKLSNKHKPKTGKKMSAADMLTAAKNKMKSIFG